MRVLVDSGPLVALFDRDDAFHGRVVGFVQGFRGIFVTTLPVVTEVSHLLDFHGGVQRDFLRWVRDGAVALAEVTREDMGRLCELIEKYADRPMDFADATLVLAGERLGVGKIASLDSDFDIYRMHGRRAMENVFPR